MNNPMTNDMRCNFCRENEDWRKAGYQGESDLCSAVVCRNSRFHFPFQFYLSKPKSQQLSGTTHQRAMHSLISSMTWNFPNTEMSCSIKRKTKKHFHLNFCNIFIVTHLMGSRHDQGATVDRGALATASQPMAGERSPSLTMDTTTF